MAYAIEKNKCLTQIPDQKPGSGISSAVFNADTNEAGGDFAFSGGSKSKANGDNSFAFGTNCKSENTACVTMGTNCTADGSVGYGFAFGNYLTAKNYQFCVGMHNKAIEDSSGDGTAKFVVGIGSILAKKNGFRVNNSGNVYGTGTFNASGADYAEMFEWVDGNEKGVDRRGLFVTLHGDKIEIANSLEDYILGVVSATPAILGDSYFGDTWHGMYLTDVFGEMLRDKEGNPILNPDYNPDREYISRNSRQEWSPIGMMGKLVVVDDGTCTADGYCTVGTGGIGTAGETGYRVMKRLDENHVMILFRHV